MAGTGKLLNDIINQAQEKSEDQVINWYHLLYGYIKVTSMSDVVLQTIYEDDEDKRELQKVRAILDKSGLDLNLTKTALPLIWNSRAFSDASAPEILDRHPAELLEELIKSDAPELKLLMKGSTLDKVLEYVKENKQDQPTTPSAQKPEKKESPADDKETPKEKEEEHQTFHFADLIEKTREMNLILQERIIGQDEAIGTFLQGYFKSEFLKPGKDDQQVPLFLYAGPPGVGKTMLALEAAKLLDRPYQLFPMTEYMDQTAEQVFRGTPKNYSQPKEGRVTAFVQKHPGGVLIFDEIDKADSSVVQLFLQILDRGVLTDSFTEQEVSFRDTMIIFTTNVGKTLYEENRDENLSSLPTRVVIKAIEEERDPRTHERIFPSSLCSRFTTGNVIMFNHLQAGDLIKIAEKKFDICRNALDKAYGYELQLDPKLSTILLFGLGSEMDARTVSARAEQLINQELYELGRHMPDPKELEKIKKVSFLLDLSDEGDEISELMNNDETTNVVMVAEEEQWKDLPIGDGCKIHFVKNKDELTNLLSSQDVDLVIIDVYYRPSESDNSYLSLDDYRSEGINMVNIMNRKFADIPLYLLEKSQIDIEDKQVFRQRGVRGFILASDPTELADAVVKLTDRLYLQKRAQDLSGRGRVLTYNTAQSISADASEASIQLYDFHIGMAVDAADRDALLDDAERPTEKFDDVIGAENAKAELKSFIEYMKKPRNYIASGKTPPKGVLLYGPPGTGKTMLARAMAGESDVSFFPTSASSFGKKWLGESERGIRELFRKARSYAPSVIFIDEIDAIGKERIGSEFTHHTESMLNALLTEMDGFKSDPSKPVFVLAATNYDLDGSKSNKHSVLDQALVRRFDNRIYVDLPTAEERKLYMTRYMKDESANLSEEVLENLANRTTGQSLATLKAILELAKRNANKESDEVGDEYLLEAFEEYMYGEKKDWDEDYYRSVAIHEAGHAWISWLSGTKPSYVSIVSRGDFGGYMQQSNENTPSYSKEDLLWQIRICLAGRASEVVYLGETKGINTGIGSDLKQATDYALNMICRYGMGDHAFASMDPATLMQSVAARDVLDEVDKILRNEMDETVELIRKGQEKIDRLVDVLLRDNQAIEGEIKKAFEG